MQNDNDKLTENNTKSNGRFIDERNHKYGHLTVLSYVGSNNGAYWLCQCSCGNTVIVKGVKLRRNLIKSCGHHWKLQKGEPRLMA